MKHKMICRKGKKDCKSGSVVLCLQHGRIPERPKGADCKSVVDDFEGSNPSPPITKNKKAEREAVDMKTKRFESFFAHFLIFRVP